jgi:demethylmenaquinone methyltransferase/2-methoxy-6-polyprenyl-1,4-benzoquinol methylase
MPFPEAEFDCIGISFAFRNLTYKNPLAKAHLAEIVRVLKPGGRCVIAESSQPRQKVIRELYHFYMRQYVYRVGAWLSGNKAAYRYLAESSSRYYSPAELEDLLLKSGFTKVAYRPLFFGAAGIYTAIR